MALNAVTLGQEIYALIFPALNAFDNIPDDQRLTSFGRDFVFQTWCNAIAQAVVAHIQANAHATGIDSHGDTHNLVIV